MLNWRCIAVATETSGNVCFSKKEVSSMPINKQMTAALCNYDSCPYIVSDLSSWWFIAGDLLLAINYWWFITGDSSLIIYNCCVIIGDLWLVIYHRWVVAGDLSLSICLCRFRDLLLLLITGDCSLMICGWLIVTCDFLKTGDLLMSIYYCWLLSSSVICWWRFPQ